MPGMFCRHNRLTSKCPICARELREATPVRHVTVRKPGATSTPKSRAKSSKGASSGSRGSGRLVTRQLARATDDGYRNPLTPGLKATADAERLAGGRPPPGAAAGAAGPRRGRARRRPPPAPAPRAPRGPSAPTDDPPDVEHATWL